MDFLLKFLPHYYYKEIKKDYVSQSNIYNNNYYLICDFKT